MERGLICTTDVVKNILDGRQTQDRRPMRPQPNENVLWNEFVSSDKPGYFKATGRMIGENSTALCNKLFKNPYGQKGDRLWIRETWRVGAWSENSGEIAVDYKADDFPRNKWLTVQDEEMFDRLWLQSTIDCEKKKLSVSLDGRYHWKPGENPCRWRPSIHMPRWASRMLLEINDIRIEKLCDISNEDMQKEGLEFSKQHKDLFGEFWDGFYGKTEFSWNKNPFVWVIDFKVLDVAGARE